MDTSHSCETTDDALGRKVSGVIIPATWQLAAVPLLPRTDWWHRWGQKGLLSSKHAETAVTVLCVSMTAMFIAISLYKQLIPMLTP